MDGRPGNTRRKGIYLLPNLVTTGGLFAGFYSIVASIDGNFHLAAWAIFAAMLLDGLDGRVARLTSTASEFGKEFDSLADMVSFGLAPAIVVYQWGVERLAGYGAIWGRLGWLAAFLYVAAAAFRLGALQQQRRARPALLPGSREPGGRRRCRVDDLARDGLSGLRGFAGARRRRHDHGRHGLADDVALRLRELQGRESRRDACDSSNCC